MKFGMSDAQFEVLDQIVLRPLKEAGALVYLFGSRSTGQHHPYSDVDILYRGDVPVLLVSDIKDSIEDSLFPFKVELVNDSNLAESYKASVYSQLIRL
jgi:predicted nucleotidyltransferase